MAEIKMTNETLSENALFNGEKKKKNKNAYRAMSALATLLFIFSFLSDAFSYTVSYLFATHYQKIQAFFVSAVMLLFRTDKQSAIGVAKMLLTNSVITEILSIILSFVTMVIPTLIFAKSVKISSDEYFPTKGKKLSYVFPFFCLCQLLCVSLSAFSQGVYDFLFPQGSLSDVSQNVATSYGDFDIFTVIVRILLVCVFVPVAEELVFRGVMFSYLKKYGLFFGVVSSAALFGAAHSSPVQSVYAFGFGIMSAIAFEITGNIKTSVIVHAMNNFVTVCAEYLPQILGNKNYAIFYSLFETAVLVFAVYGLYRFCLKDALLEKMREKSKENDKDIGAKAELFELFCVPFSTYLLIYACKILFGVLS